MILRNKIRGTLVYNLSHETFCGAGSCACVKGGVTVLEHHDAAGIRTLAKRTYDRTFPPVLTLLPLERKEVPDTVLQDPVIARDVSINRLQVVGQTVAGVPTAGTGPVRGRRKKKNPDN